MNKKVLNRIMIATIAAGLLGGITSLGYTMKNGEDAKKSCNGRWG